MQKFSTAPFGAATTPTTPPPATHPPTYPCLPVSIMHREQGGGDIERPGFWSPPSPLPQFYRYASKGSTNGYGRLYAPSSTPTTSSYDTLLPPPPPARDTDEEGEDDDDDDLRPSHADNGTEETKAFQTSRAGYPGYSDVRESGEEGGVSSQGVRVGGEREIPPGEERFSASEALNPGLRRGGDGEGGCEQDEEPAPPSRSSTDLVRVAHRKFCLAFSTSSQFFLTNPVAQKNTQFFLRVTRERFF